MGGGLPGQSLGRGKIEVPAKRHCREAIRAWPYPLAGGRTR